MKTNIDKNLVEFTPENDAEKADLTKLWRLLVDCVRFNKKMVPVGEYFADRDAFARFAVEGMDPEKKTDDFPEVYAEEDCICVCMTCNKQAKLKKGDRVPPCCGKLMEIMD